MDEFTLIMSIVKEISALYQMYYIWSNLYTVARVLCAPNVTMVIG